MLASNDVVIWCCRTLEYDDERLSTLTRALSPDERARAARFVRRENRRDFIAAHALLRHALSRHDGATPPGAWRLISGPTGKPELSDAHASSLTFNLSHTEGIAVCAVGLNRQVGIDVECIRRHNDETAIARRFFAPAEVAAFDALHEPARVERFVELWTLKEAYVKGLGSGLTTPLDSCAFDFEDVVLRFSAGTDTGRWRFWLFEPARHARVALCAGVAADQEQLRVRFGDTHEALTLLRHTGVPDLT